MTREPLFYLTDGSAVYHGDVLHVAPAYLSRAGAKCRAEFRGDGDSVTVRSIPHGAVPTVPITALMREPHPDTVDRELIAATSRDVRPGDISGRDLRMFRLGKQVALGQGDCAAQSSSAQSMLASKGFLSVQLPGAPRERHTLIVGTTGKGRSIFLEREAARRGIALEALQRELEPTDEERVSEHVRAEARAERKAVRIAAVREAYWRHSDLAEFSVISDAIYNFCGSIAPTAEQIKIAFAMLPDGVIGSGISWDFEDTEVRDSVYGYIRDHAAEVMLAIAPAA